MIRKHFFKSFVIRDGLCPQTSKNYLYVATQGNCRVKVEHLLVQSVLVLSISQLLFTFLMICNLYGCSNLNVY